MPGSNYREWRRFGAQAPAAPSGLSATIISHTQVNLSWTDNSTGETSFRIERSTNNVTFTEIGTAAANATTYSDLTALGWTIYYYRVRARGPGGNSAYSNTASAATFTGEDGDLVADGVRVEVDATTPKDFNSITIINGGNIILLGDTGAWHMIACKGNFTMSGGARFYGLDNLDLWYNGVGDPLSFNYTATAPDGTALSFTGTAAQGGSGGDSGISYGAPGGNGLFGNGGGGAGADVGDDGSDGFSGAGGAGANGSLGGLSVPNFGGGEDGQNGNNGDDNQSGVDQPVGGGGSGGSQGNSSKALYLKILANINVDGGSGFVFVGHSGGSGGTGGGDTTGIGDGGGGGGGGAGGFGGKVLVKVHGTNSGIAIQDHYGGSQGFGGVGGSGATPDQNGSDGFQGEGGQSGSFSITTF